jgi:hypothetical protein
METKSFILFSLVYVFIFSGHYVVSNFLTILYPNETFISFAIFYGVYSVTNLFAPLLLTKNNYKMWLFFSCCTFSIYIGFAGSEIPILLFIGSAIRGAGNSFVWFAQGILLSEKEIGIFYSLFNLSSIFGNFLALIILVTGFSIRDMIFSMMSLAIIGTVLSLFVPNSNLSNSVSSKSVSSNISDPLIKTNENGLDDNFEFINKNISNLVLRLRFAPTIEYIDGYLSDYSISKRSITDDSNIKLDEETKKENINNNSFKNCERTPDLFNLDTDVQIVVEKESLTLEESLSNPDIIEIDQNISTILPLDYKKIFGWIYVFKKCYFIIPSIIYQSLGLNITYQIIPRLLINFTDETAYMKDIYNATIYFAYGAFAMIFSYLWGYLMSKNWKYVVLPYTFLEILCCGSMYLLSMYNTLPYYYILIGAIRGIVDYGVNNAINISLSKFDKEDIGPLFALYRFIYSISYLASSLLIGYSSDLIVLSLGASLSLVSSLFYYLFSKYQTV